MADPRQHRRIGNLVAIQVQDGQHGTVSDRVEKFVRVPRRGEGSGLGFSVTDHTGNDEVRVVKGRSIGVSNRVAEFTPFVDGAGGFGRNMAGNPTGE